MSSPSFFLITAFLCIFFTINGWASFHLHFAVKFCKTNSRNLTIDSLIALAILRDSLSDICSAYQLTGRLMNEVCYLSNSVDYNFKSMSDHKSSHKLAFLLNIKWHTHPFLEVDAYDISMQEYENCIFEMANHLNQKCNITDFCVNHFSKELYKGSNLLKQAFYYLVTLSTSCQSKKASSSYLAYKIGTLSRLLMTEFSNYYSVRNFSTRYRQHLLEQIVYGGLGGYLQMAHPVMMDEIMSWQDESGCFKTVKKNEHIHSDLIHFEREVQLKDGCLLRLTSMAAAALAMHIGRFSTGEVYKPDFHYILQMENIFAQNNRKFPDLIESRSDSSRISKTPYANVPDTVL
nr:hypothetical transcript [Hymenolepis microstoma]